MSFTPFIARAPILVEPGDYPAAADAAIAALLAAEAPVFERGALLVTPTSIQVQASDGRRIQCPDLTILNHVSLRDILDQTACFYRSGPKGRRTINAPLQVAQTILERRNRGLRNLAGIISAPTLRMNGDPIEHEGHNQEAGLFLSFDGVRFPGIPEEPTQEDAVAALANIMDVYSTFPFVGDVDRAVAASGLLTALVRRSLSTAPLHAVTARAPGTGKSLLVDVTSAIATGRTAPVITPGGTVDEFEKRLDAALLAGHPIVSIDNVDRTLESDKLCVCLSQEYVGVRPLGTSQSVQVPTSSSFFATGNNLKYGRDLPRRIVQVRLDAACERPEDREFDRDAVEYALSFRAGLVIDGLTLIRAYARAGRPNPLILGGFRDWSLMVRNPLIWAGAADPAASLEHTREGDPDLEALRAVMAAWHQCFNDEETTVGQVMEKAESDKALKLALMAVAASRGNIDPTRLGKWLGKKDETRVGSAYFLKCGLASGGVRLWRLVGFVGLVG